MSKKEWVPVNYITDLKVGDTVKGRLSGERYVVTAVGNGSLLLRYWNAERSDDEFLFKVRSIEFVERDAPEPPLPAGVGRGIASNEYTIKSTRGTVVSFYTYPSGNKPCVSASVLLSPMVLDFTPEVLRWMADKAEDK